MNSSKWSHTGVIWWNVLKEDWEVPRFCTPQDQLNWMPTLRPTKYKMKAGGYMLSLMPGVWADFNE